MFYVSAAIVFCSSHSSQYMTEHSAP